MPTYQPLSIFAALVLCGSLLLASHASSATSTENDDHSGEMCGQYPCSSLPGIGDTCCPFSDGLLKSHIVPISNAIDSLMKIRGVTYKWKVSGLKDVGLIAQDVESVWPEAVTTMNGVKTVDYFKLIAPLIEAVRQQQAEIDGLKAELEEQKRTRATNINTKIINPDVNQSGW